MSQAGQVQGGEDRHEKDDRHRLDDRSHYVLGWSHEAKMAVLEADEHFTDFGGKSGAQKEKLAYMVLAARLAYQFGLDGGAGRSRKLRFVVIDEAFGRGSDESARFGLEPFRCMRLQLLIVTLLPKIHVNRRQQGYYEPHTF